MTPQFQVRMATVADSAVIAWHRARMFQDMGYMPEHLFGSFREKSKLGLRSFLASGEYKGWLVSPADLPDKIVAGGGVQLRRTLPQPVGESIDKIRIGDGQQGVILNIYTEPEWRRRGLARLLMETIMGWARVEKLDSLVLHASGDGRSLYEQLGFISTNEMRLRESS